MNYWSLFVGVLILAVALPMCCGYYVVDGPQADDPTIGIPCADGKGCEKVTGSMCSAANGNGKCICNDEMHVADDGKSCVSGTAAIGSSCFMNIGCETVANAKCSSSDGKGQCTCNDGYHDQGDNKTCAQDTKLGEACGKDNNCTGTTECTSEGFCICKAGFHAGDDLLCVAGNATIGITCYNNIGCEKVTDSKCNAAIGKGQCACKDGMHANDDGKSCVAGKATIGSPCFMNTGCEEIKNSTCSSSDGEGQCDCSVGYHDQGDGETCAQDSKLGDACSKYKNCTGNTECTSEGFCTCKAGFYAGNDLICVAVIGSTCNDTATCEDLLANTECNDGQCQCKSGYLEKSGICKPGAGSYCNETESCGDQYATCINSTCQCNENYTAMEGVCRPGLHAECDATDNPCIDSVAVCGQNKTCECPHKYKEHGNKCLAHEIDVRGIVAVGGGYTVVYVIVGPVVFVCGGYGVYYVYD
ncbi:cell death abnormality protein 1-like isoform X2 [Ischnura elegans]|uniref:cell death abnormality protein 1-like isoform X2 n=1 Tax=Ischnura elegans TaxID=197161 RepID=UPI001ED8A985|nr:cell death abnormality protein 1-like isoform X2 [Ischnura elegans]